ncbi:MAG TPA: hypothetical protein VER38_04785 [Candidatus Eisenbacteria bacterium]|nr:hypothetical protein [Candidatus Eisenbacteria bacterium]
MKRTASAAFLLLFAFALLPARAQQQPASVPIQGTVYSLKTKPASLDLLTGVGMALRLMHITTPPSARIESVGAAAPLSALKRGDIVRVQCHWSGKELVADRIEKVVVR